MINDMKVIEEEFTETKLIKNSKSIIKYLLFTTFCHAVRVSGDRDAIGHMEQLA